MMRFDNTQLQQFYERFKDIELTFNSDVIEATGLISSEIFLNIESSKWECQIHAISFVTAKIIVHLTPEDVSGLRAAEEISVNYTFLGLPPVLTRESFLVPYQLSASNAFARIGENTYLVSLESQGKGLGNLVKYLKDFIEANANAQRGAKILTYAVKPVVGEKAILMITVLDPDEIMEMPCTMVRFHAHEDNENAVTIGLLFDKDSVPLDYKTRINRTLKRREGPTKAVAKEQPRVERTRLSRTEIGGKIQRVISVLSQQATEDGPVDKAILKKAISDLTKINEILKSS
jgi:hypothetical protein